MKAQVGDYIRSSVKGTDGIRRQSPLKVIRIDGDVTKPKTAGYELEDGSIIADWEIEMDDVMLESEVTG